MSKENAGGRRIVRGNVMHHRADAETVFPLLCPVREYDWIEFWECRLLHSESGAAELDCVFTTDLPDMQPMTWTCSRHEPPRRIEYVMTGRHVLIRLGVKLHDEPGGCRSEWTRTYTGLDAEGDAWVEGMSEEKYAAQASLLERMLNHYLDTGKRLTLG